MADPETSLVSADTVPMPAWAVVVLFAMFTAITTGWELSLQKLEERLRRRHQEGLLTVVEAVKSELLAFGVLSLVLKVIQPGLSQICIPLPPDTYIDTSYSSYDDPCAARGQKQVYSNKVSTNVHVLIFMMAVSHVFLAGLTIVMCSMKVARWKRWEASSADTPVQPDRQQLAVCRSLPLWLSCLIRQYTTGVTRVQYHVIRNKFMQEIQQVCQLSSAPTLPYHSLLLNTTQQQLARLVQLNWFVWVMALVLVATTGQAQWAMLLVQLIVSAAIMLGCGTRLQMALVSMENNCMASVSLVRRARGCLDTATRTALQRLPDASANRASRSLELPTSKWSVLHHFGQSGRWYASHLFTKGALGPTLHNKTQVGSPATQAAELEPIEEGWIKAAATGPASGSPRTPDIRAFPCIAKLECQAGSGDESSLAGSEPDAAAAGPTSIGSCSPGAGAPAADTTVVVTAAGNRPLQQAPVHIDPGEDQEIPSCQQPPAAAAAATSADPPQSCTCGGGECVGPQPAAGAGASTLAAENSQHSQQSQQQHGEAAVCSNCGVASCSNGCFGMSCMPHRGFGQHRGGQLAGNLRNPKLLLLVYKIAYFQVAFALAYTMFECFVQEGGAHDSDILAPVGKVFGKTAIPPVAILALLMAVILAMSLHSAWCVLPVFTLCNMARQETLVTAAQYMAAMERNTAATLPALYLQQRLTGSEMSSPRASLKIRQWRHSLETERAREP